MEAKGTLRAVALAKGTNRGKTPHTDGFVPDRGRHRQTGGGRAEAGTLAPTTSRSG